MSLEGINHLLETLKVECGETSAIVYDVEEHARRLFRSMQELGFKSPHMIDKEDEFAIFFQTEIKNYLQYQLKFTVSFKSTKDLSNITNPLDVVYRLRIIFSIDGSYKVSLKDYDRDIEADWNIKILAPEEFQINSQDLKWRHKFYPRHDFSQHLDDCDEVIWTNQNGFICEGSYSNVFFQDENSNWHTPSLENNILNGVMRETLVFMLNANEGFYTAKDLHKAKRILITNSMIRGKEVNLIKTAKAS